MEHTWAPAAPGTLCRPGALSCRAECPVPRDTTTGAAAAPHAERYGPALRTGSGTAMPPGIGGRSASVGAPGYVGQREGFARGGVFAGDARGAAQRGRARIRGLPSPLNPTPDPLCGQD